MRWKTDDYDPPPEDSWEDEGGSLLLPPEECEDWDIPPLREVLTRLACGE